MSLLSKRSKEREKTKVLTSGFSWGSGGCNWVSDCRLRHVWATVDDLILCYLKTYSGWKCHVSDELHPRRRLYQSTHQLHWQVLRLCCKICRLGFRSHQPWPTIVIVLYDASLSVCKLTVTERGSFQLATGFRAVQCYSPDSDAWGTGEAFAKEAQEATSTMIKVENCMVERFKR